MGAGVMNIQVRVLAANARRTLRGVRAEMAMVQAQSAKTAAVSPVGKRSFADMTKAGNQMQWVGRQLQYNFTLPLLLAGAAATKFQLDQEKAMVHVAKVYGDTSDAAAYWGKNTTGWMKGATDATSQASKVFDAELGALEKSFDALSVKYAVQKKEILEVAGAWAAAGVSGTELAKSVENTLVASNIGDMDAAHATEALISIQAQYNMSAGKLTRTLAELNAIENATTVDMGGLIKAMAKSGSAAAASGTSARYLASMISAITPAAGTASQAGNALKTILSRISKPTAEGAAAMKQLGVDTEDMAWKALSGNEKLQKLQKGFNGLSRSQQLANASATVGIYQYNRYIQLLKDMGREHGNYNKSLNATASKDKVFATMQKELGTILESNPKRLARMGIALQNSLADTIQPLIPHMVYLAQQVAALARAFADLPPSIQKVALFAGLLLITLPLLLRYMGSLRTLFIVTRMGILGAARALGILSTATVVQTVVDGQAVAVTEMRRRGLIGLFITMLTAPFKWFAAGAWMMARSVSTAFTFMAFAAIGQLKLLFMKTAAPFAAYVAFMTQTVLTGGLAAAFKWTWASILATFTRSSATMLAIGAGTSTTLVAQTAGGVAVQRGLWTGFAATTTGIFAAMRARIIAIWISTIAFLASPAAIIAALSAVGGALLAFAGTVVSILLSPWGIAIGAILGLLYAFRNEIAQVWNNIVNYFQSSGDLGTVFGWMVTGVLKAFNALPQGVQNAMIAVVKIVRDAALAVYEWFSYINPFARHSPSLVDNVTFGMASVVKSFSTLGQIKSYTDGAYRELSKFGDLTASMQSKSMNVGFAEDRANLSKGGASKETLSSYDKLVGKLKSMKNIYGQMGAAIVSLEKRDVVARRKMDDAIFSNTFAQKKLRLEMLAMEDAVGTLDDVQSKLAAISGEQEILRGTQSDLKNSGAGSDILSYYDDQLKALDGQRDSLESSANKMQVIDDRMKTLQKEAERLDLEKAMKFDKVDHKLEKMREQYDLVGDSIGDIESGIRAALSAQESLNSASSKSARKASSARKKALGGRASKSLGGTSMEGAADFPDVTGKKGLGTREDWSSQVKEIEDFTAATIASSGDLFAQVNPFKSMKGWFTKTWEGKVKPSLDSAGKWVTNFFGSAFDGVKLPKSVTSTGDFLGDAFDPDKIKGVLETGKKAATDFVALFWPDIKRIFTAGWEGLKGAWDSIGPEIAGFADLWPPIKDAIVGIWNVLKPVLAVVGAALLVLAKIITSVIGHTIGPLIKAIGIVIGGFVKMLRGAVRIVAGVIKVIMGILTLDPKMILTGFGDIGKGVWEIFSGMFKMIFGVFRGAWAIIKGIVLGIVGGIVGFFKWLYDVLVGHSIVPDLIDKIIEVFKWLGSLPVWVWNNVIKPIWNFFVSGKNKIVNVVKSIWGAVKAAWSTLKGAGRWVWDNVVAPIGQRFVRGVINIAGTARGLWGKVKTAFSALKGLGKWIWDNSLGKVLQKFKDLINNIGDFVSANKGKITSPFKSIVNFAIGGINKMTSGLNKVADVLPGLSWKIGTIPKLAQGGQIPGRKVGNGWITSGARAIVGEGKPNHPEYVVPTDPTHRGRALSLWKSLGQKIGALDANSVPAMDGNIQQTVDGVPAYSIGGVIEAAAGGVKSAASEIKKLAKNAASIAYKPFGRAVDKKISDIKWKYARQPLESVHDKVRGWIKGADQFGNKVSKRVGGKWTRPLESGYSIGGGIGSYKGHNGQDFPVRSGAYVKAVTSGKVTSSRDIIRGGKLASYGKVIELSHGGGYKSLYAHNSDRLVKTGQSVSSGQSIARSGSTGNSSGPHLHLSMWKDGKLKAPLDVLRGKGVKMAHGGIIRKSTGGTTFTGGEAGQDEAIVPLPRDWKTGGMGSNEFNFFGDLSFPNVKNGDDAKSFLDNLSSVVKD